MERFYSNGKLLLTGEYVVLDGAKALALPTKFGQDLVVENGKDKSIGWKSFDHDGSLWFEASIPFESIRDKEKFEDNIKNTLVQILYAAWLLKPSWLEADGYVVSTHLSFPRLWGLGTSSTLINNVAQWLGIDAYALLQNSFGGSGYDIACAQHDSPIIYRWAGKPIVAPVEFDPHFKNQLYFVYLNKKQSSKKAIAAYREKPEKHEAIAAISLITEAVARAQNPETFSALLENHEAIMSEILGLETVKSALFPDFNGLVKSLGAWGGDFVLAVSHENPVPYFKARGYDTIIPYSEMIL